MHVSESAISLPVFLTDCKLQRRSRSSARQLRRQRYFAHAALPRAQAVGRRRVTATSVERLSPNDERSLYSHYIDPTTATANGARCTRPLRTTSLRAGCPADCRSTTSMLESDPPPPTTRS